MRSVSVRADMTLFLLRLELKYVCVCVCVCVRVIRERGRERELERERGRREREGEREKELEVFCYPSPWIFVARRMPVALECNPWSASFKSSEGIPLEIVREVVPAMEHNRAWTGLWP